MCVACKFDRASATGKIVKRPHEQHLCIYAVTACEEIKNIIIQCLPITTIRVLIRLAPGQLRRNAQFLQLFWGRPHSGPASLHSRGRPGFMALPSARQQRLSYEVSATRPASVPGPRPARRCCRDARRGRAGQQPLPGQSRADSESPSRSTTGARAGCASAAASQSHCGLSLTVWLTGCAAAALAVTRSQSD